MKNIITVLIVITALVAGWLLRGYFGGGSSVGLSAKGSSGERKVLYYQSAMHPWVKSDKPGRCTICGMALTPVYEGEKGLDAESGEIGRAHV